MDSVLNKRSELLVYLQLHKPVIIALVEILPKNLRYPVDENEIALDGYTLFHNLNAHGRGIALYVHCSLKVKEVHFPNQDFNECLFGIVQLAGRDSLLVGVLYRSPSCNEENNRQLNRHMVEIGLHTASHKLLMGDFNYREIDWANDVCTTTPERAPYQFHQATHDAYLIQHQTTHTRMRNDQVPSVLDLIFSNEEGMVKNLEVHAAIGKSDHAVLTLDFQCSWSQDNTDTLKYMYGKGDYEELRKMMSCTDWEEQLDGKTVEQAWTTVRSQLETAVASCIPKKTTRSGDARSRKPWNTSVTIGKVKMKNNMYRRWRNSRDNEDYLSYAKARNQARSACRKAVRLYEKDIASQIKQNPKHFWRYVKSKLKVRHGVPNLEREDGSLTETDFDKAEVLNSFFKRVYTLEDDSELPNVEQRRVLHPSQEVTFTEDDIERLLSKLNIAKSAGPDGLHPRILKELSVQLAQPLFILFRMSLETGMLPDDWKIAQISPIFKKGHRCKPGNYRPVSLTAIICKILEKLVRRNIIDHLEQNELIDPAQHGFVKGRSCVTNLLETFEQWTHILDDGGCIDVSIWTL